MVSHRAIRQSLLVALTLACTHAPSGPPRRMLVVRAPSWTATTGTLQRWEDSGSGWTAIGAPVEVALGRTGLAWGRGKFDPQPGPQKKEGDGKSPAGRFALGPAFGYGESLQTQLEYVHTDRWILCVDDVKSRSYNRLVDTGEPRIAMDWQSAEEMRRQDQLYEMGVVVHHNDAPPQPGAGSCIFLHVWRGPGSVTSGCTAMAPDALREVLAWVTRDTELVELPDAEYARLRAAWRLP